MRFCCKSVLFVFNEGVVLSVCHDCFLPGSMSHWAACSAGFHHQLPAETGWEVHHFLPAQLWQARLLQGQAGGIFSLEYGEGHCVLIWCVIKGHFVLHSLSVSLHLWARLPAAGASPPGMGRRSLDPVICWMTQTVIKKSPTEWQTLLQSLLTQTHTNYCKLTQFLEEFFFWQKKTPPIHIKFQREGNFLSFYLHDVSIKTYLFPACILLEELTVRHF